MTFTDVKGSYGELRCSVAPYAGNILIFSIRVVIRHNSPNSPFTDVKTRVLLTPLASSDVRTRIANPKMSRITAVDAYAKDHYGGIA